MLITGRQATALLATAGLAPRQARQVLDAGLAGAALPTSAALLYDRGAVDALVRRPRLRLEQLDALCPAGVFIARAGRRVLDLRAPPAARLAAFGDGWRFGPMAGVWLQFQLERCAGRFPFLVTVAGYVAAGADITSVQGCEGGGHALELAPPGDWFASARDRRLRTGPGRPWEIRGLPWSAGTRPRVGE